MTNQNNDVGADVERCGPGTDLQPVEIEMRPCCQRVAGFLEVRITATNRDDVLIEVVIARLFLYRDPYWLVRQRQVPATIDGSRKVGGGRATRHEHRTLRR